MEKKIKLRPPMMPNYLFAEKREGQPEIQVAVSDLSKTEAEEFGEFMKQQFIKHWEKKVKNKKP